MKRLKFLGVVAAIFVIHAPARAALLGKLADHPGLTDMPMMSAAEKLQVVDQALLLIDGMFVHRDLKLSEFGYDAAPDLRAMRARVDGISDEEFHFGMARAFFRLRDRHTNYYRPKPGGCYSVYLPLGLEELGDGRIVVSYIDPDGLPLTPDLAKIQLGDELLTYGGFPAEEALNAEIPWAGGANRGADRQMALGGLVFHWGRERAHRDGTTVRLQFKPVAGGADYQANLEWLLWESKITCIDQAPASAPLSAKRGVDDRRRELQEVFAKREFHFSTASSAEDLSNLTASDLEPLKYKKIVNGDGEFGYIQLTDFDEYEGKDTAVYISELLRGEFAGVKGVIVDVRGNPGGQINVGERLAKIFTDRQIFPEEFRLRATKLNFDFIGAIDYFTEYQPLITTAQLDGHSLSYSSPVDASSEINTLPRAFKGKVAVIVDANCYSTCDIFAAQMQDHGLATIWGRHAATGAGGANVFEQADFVSWAEGWAESPFKPLPRGMGMRVSWRQAMRTGAHFGELIENRGVEPDRLVPVTLRDLLANDADLVATVTASMR